MNFIATPIKGVFIVEPARHADERGFFARTWCRREFAEHGLDAELDQCSISYNTARGTLRGMHLQRAPYAEAKLVRCTRGAIYDVALDLRAGSASCKRWVTCELTAENRRALFIPHGFAHGFQTLQDDTEVLYQI